MVVDSGTWHHGLMARWWAEFVTAGEPGELEYFRAAINKFGQPALDLGCGAGRILIPMLGDGFDVDGSDVSADMIAQARLLAEKKGFSPRLTVEPMHDLQLPRKYRTIYMCGAFGIGGSREHDRDSLRRAYQHLEPGGALLIANHWFPYGDTDAKRWSQWLPGNRADIPREWPTEGERRTTSDGDEIEMFFRMGDLNPLLQRTMLQMRARLWHDGQIVKEEAHDLHENIYFAQEILLMLDDAGFRDVTIEGGYTGLSATPDDGMVVFVARRPA
ncbi:MAG TPA: class I SAM-dependent methyltransferase [Candidatus Acidoferrum sp.]|nr:class I SAM-dependent methyltransferase [Candidatus Acidoferrum sp.]